jgi:hypothetical protein
MATRAELSEWQTIMSKPRDLGRSRWWAKSEQFDVMIGCYGAMMRAMMRDGGGGRLDVGGPAGTSKGDGGLVWDDDMDAETGALVAEGAALLRKCKIQARRVKVGRPTRGLLGPAATPLVPPSRELADRAANLYFASFESTYVTRF